MEAMAINLKELKEEGAYIKIPQGLSLRSTKSGGKLPKGAVLVGSLINTFSSVDSTCNRKYKGISSDLGISSGTVANAISVLSDLELIAKPNRSSYIFKKSEVSKKFFLRLPLLFLTSIFRIKGEFPRPLTIAEALVLSFLYTRCKNKKNPDKTVTASIPEIARYLKLSERTVWSALSVLLRADLIHRAADEKGVNGEKKSTYHLNEYLLRLKSSQKKTQGQAVSNPSVVAADERAERERYYAKRRQEAETAAERAREGFEKDHPEYVEISRELGTLERESAKAEVFAPATLPELTKRAQAKRKEKVAFLRRFGLTEQAFQPQYQCPVCSDTGFRPDGVACDCYNKRE